MSVLEEVYLAWWFADQVNLKAEKLINKDEGEKK
jgi:hypothetical protein